MMRHFILTVSVSALAPGMGYAAFRTHLVALSGFSLTFGALQLGTAARTIALAAVTVAADQYRCVAAGA